MTKTRQDNRRQGKKRDDSTKHKNPNEISQEKKRQDMTGISNNRQGKANARQDTIRQHKKRQRDIEKKHSQTHETRQTRQTRQDEIRKNKTRRQKERQSKAKRQEKTRQDKT